MTNVLALAAGGIFTQDKGQDFYRLVFMIQAHKPTIQWYSAYERKLVMIYIASFNWVIILEDCPPDVTIMTDHKPLTLLMDQKLLSRSQTPRLWFGLFQST